VEMAVREWLRKQEPPSTGTEFLNLCQDGTNELCQKIMLLDRNKWRACSVEMILRWIFMSIGASLMEHPAHAN
jgi:hypothetical protein